MVETKAIEDFTDGGFHVFYVTDFRFRELSLESSNLYESWNRNVQRCFIHVRKNGRRLNVKREWKMQRLTIGVLMAVGLPSTVFADSPDTPEYPSAKVSYSDFKSLVETVEEHRSERLVGLDEFLEMSKDPNTIILDTLIGRTL